MKPVLVWAVLTAAVTAWVYFAYQNTYRDGLKPTIIGVVCPSCDGTQGYLPFLARDEDRAFVPNKVELVCDECKKDERNCGERGYQWKDF